MFWENSWSSVLKDLLVRIYGDVIRNCFDCENWEKLWKLYNEGKISVDELTERFEMLVNLVPPELAFIITVDGDLEVVKGSRWSVDTSKVVEKKGDRIVFMVHTHNYCQYYPSGYDIEYIVYNMIYGNLSKIRYWGIVSRRGRRMVYFIVNPVDLVRSSSVARGILVWLRDYEGLLWWKALRSNKVVYVRNMGFVDCGLLKRVLGEFKTRLFWYNVMYAVGELK